jgi:uncharacterized protein HemY
LQYEGTRREVAQGFKDQGNEMVKGKRWGDAKEFYNRAIVVLTDKSQDRWGKGEDPELDTTGETQLAEQCYTNRALCNLELSTSTIPMFVPLSSVQFQEIAHKA